MTRFGAGLGQVFGAGFGGTEMKIGKVRINLISRIRHRILDNLLSAFWNKSLNRLWYNL